MKSHRNGVSRGTLGRLSCSITPRWIVAAIAICGGLSRTERCQAREASHDDQSWASVSLVTPVSANTNVKLDGLVQISADRPHMARQLFRGTVLTKVRDRVMAGGGYVWTRVDTDAATFVEHRGFQEIDVTQPLDWRGATLSSRTHLEERIRNGERGLSLRIRQRTRLDVPVTKAGTAIVGWNEYFHELRDTRWAGGSGPGVMINFVGVHIPISRRVAVEPGYLNQTSFTPGRNSVIHAAAIFVTVRR